jgi:hypothetical protein
LKFRKVLYYVGGRNPWVRLLLGFRVQTQAILSSGVCFFGATFLGGFHEWAMIPTNDLALKAGKATKTVQNGRKLTGKTALHNRNLGGHNEPAPTSAP